MDHILFKACTPMIKKFCEVSVHSAVVEWWRDHAFVVILVIALRPQTPKNIRGSWSHYTDTSEPVDGNGAQNMVTVQSRFEPVTFQSLAHKLINCSNRAHKNVVILREYRLCVNSHLLSLNGEEIMTLF
jgi:hypothetical protein